MSGPSTAGRLTCDASSTSATSKVRRDSSAWRQDRHVVATMRLRRARLDRSAPHDTGCLLDSANSSTHTIRISQQHAKVMGLLLTLACLALS